ncbi:MAG: hypothetical protein RIQ81_1302 [Pseudomonadota bacterium]|jgi:glycosyltransferase involved in cell wall biosynthesis
MSDKEVRQVSITWCIPCLNEELAIAAVVERIRKACPQGRIIVFDNGSSDRSANLAKAAGAEVRIEKRLGKGHVVRKMFRECDADILIMIDGDNTNDVEAWPSMIAPIIEHRADIVVGSRLEQAEQGAFRPFHLAGNQMLGGLMRWLFDLPVKDVLSGYRAFSRAAYKTLPVESGGFEIETEMTLKAVELKWAIEEIPTRFAQRPPGSESKLRTIHDGLIIGFAIFRILKDSKPFTFFGSISVVLCLLAAALWNGAFPAAGEGARFLAVLSGITGLLFAVAGVILNSVSQRAKEIMHVLAMRE